MLNSVYVDGLKSLKELTLDLNPGLNVLVGPNGSGKSNILVAFELISCLNQLDYLNSVGKIGTTEISDLFDANRKDKSISIGLTGETTTTDRKFPKIKYEFECKIEYDLDSNSKLKFKSQSLKLYSCKKEKYVQIFKMYFGMNSRRGIKMSESFRDTVKLNISNENSDKKIVSQLMEIYFKSKNNILKYRSIFLEVSMIFTPLINIVEELYSLKLYNFNPNKIRNDDKRKNTPVIGKDGSRLTSVLHEIWENKEIDKPISKNKYFPRTNFNFLYKHIIGILNEISPDFTGFEVDFDDITKKIECEIMMKGKGHETITLPLTLMSDGTLKWLSLSTALLTARHMFILEEPENYLNTSMQQMFTDYARKTLERRGNFGLFSTHSETILDSLNPEEIIVTYFREGYTHTTRIEDIELLNKVMTRSGNGLGWYFLMSSLDPDENGRILPKEEK